MLPAARQFAVTSSSSLAAVLGRNLSVSAHASFPDLYEGSRSDRSKEELPSGAYPVQDDPAAQTTHPGGAGVLSSWRGCSSRWATLGSRKGYDPLLPDESDMGHSKQQQPDDHTAQLLSDPKATASAGDAGMSVEEAKKQQ
ncbi:hypothetical protein HaLaN_11058 [Haematococcus lacustris]|uniref:Uncharacterized protein n=1 Tax=Haematococcus lacustris TaxID=44745 RepID=A0A699Z6Z4_HAELA|nr:hypothetical protein HaLaN_11058 [Haematococcus lacustris]